MVLFVVCLDGGGLLPRAPLRLLPTVVKAPLFLSFLLKRGTGGLAALGEAWRPLSLIAAMLYAVFSFFCGDGVCAGGVGDCAGIPTSGSKWAR